MTEKGSFSILPFDVLKLIIFLSQNCPWHILNRYFNSIFYHAVDSKIREKHFKFAAQEGNLRLVDELVKVYSITICDNNPTFRSTLLIQIPTITTRSNALLRKAILQ